MWTRLCKTVTGVVGFDELLVAVGLALIAAALWPVVGRLALLAPGLVLVWIALPQRASFVRRIEDVPAKRRDG